jgi:hypothetical protein
VSIGVTKTGKPDENSLRKNTTLAAQLLAAPVPKISGKFSGFRERIPNT